MRLMLGLGTGVDPTLNHTGIDRYLYWSSEWLFGDSGRQRDGAKFFAWGQFGERTLNVGRRKHRRNSIVPVPASV